MRDIVVPTISAHSRRCICLFLYFLIIGAYFASVKLVLRPANRKYIMIVSFCEVREKSRVNLFFQFHPRGPLKSIFWAISAISNSNPVVQIPRKTRKIDRGTNRKISGFGNLRESVSTKIRRFSFSWIKYCRAGEVDAVQEKTHAGFRILLCDQVYRCPWRHVHWHWSAYKTCGDWQGFLNHPQEFENHGGTHLFIWYKNLNNMLEHFLRVLSRFSNSCARSLGKLCQSSHSGPRDCGQPDTLTITFIAYAVPILRRAWLCTASIRGASPRTRVINWYLVDQCV